ncbi:MAG: tetratricopeptide repeat protein [Flavobacteriales bacterium]|nr:tetratricopeptide repeat protein [Flavobacteriales bacterium]NQX97201.1 tetratricopeptide repeat protein [Flavobacteriales bacterium]
MQNVKFYILIILTAFLASCSSSKEGVTNTSKKSKPKGIELVDLPEKQQIKFKFLFHNANKERLLDNYQLAANLFLKCIEIAPQESAPYYELAHLFEASKETKLALEYSEKAVKLDGKNYWYRILYAHTLQRVGNFNAAIKEYETLIKENKGNIDLYFDLAGMQLYSGKYKESLSSFNEIEKRLGISEEISVQKEKIYIKLGDIDKAANEIQQLINKYPDNLKYQVLLADLYLANDLTDKAFTVYQEILKKDPENPYANLSLYDYHKKKGENRKASEALQKAFASPNLGIDTKMKILLSYYSETDSQIKKEALNLNKILIKTHPKEAKAYTIYADFLYQDKKLEGAKENYLKAIEFDNSKLPIWNQLMFIESELQDNESLLRDSKRALDLFPNQPLFYFFYGATNLQNKQYEEAIEYLIIGKDYVYNNPPLLAQFYANLGDANHGLKQYEASDKAYENALKIEPKNIYVLNNYGYYLSLREENLDRAEELSALCNEIEPDQSNYQDTYAWILYKQGKFVQAKEWLEKALENGGASNAVILEHLGDTHAKLQNITKALEFWKKAKKMNDGASTKFLDKKIADKKLYE